MKDRKPANGSIHWIASGPFRGQFSEVEGPLIRATNGGNLLTHRPLKPGSTYAHLTRAIEDAYIPPHSARRWKRRTQSSI